jgi:3-oxoacyl-[acyl-carrier-protein] synthase-3
MSSPAPLTAVAAAGSVENRDVQELALQAGLAAADRATLSANGLASVPVATACLPELVAEVLAGLGQAGWRAETCGAAVFTHSLETSAAELEQVDRILREALPALARAPLLLAGRPCSIIHCGIELALGLCEPGRGRTALVLGADVAPAHGERFFFGSAMGDAAVGLALGGAPVLGHVLVARSFTNVIAPNGEDSAPEQIARFRAQNPTAIRTAISATLEAAGLAWSGLAAIVPHTPNRLIWDTVAELCKFPRHRILDQGRTMTGHLNSNDVLVHFAAAARNGLLHPGDVAALVSPGFGGTRGCTLIRCGS